jgi:hypothetical protein
MLGRQEKRPERYFRTERVFFRRLVQRFSLGEKKSGHKFRIVATLVSSFNNADECVVELLAVYSGGSAL